MKYAALAALSVITAACSEAPAREPAAPVVPAVNSYGVPYGVWVDDTAATAEALRFGRIERQNICIDRMCLSEDVAMPTRGAPPIANTTPERRPGAR